MCSKLDEPCNPGALLHWLTGRSASSASTAWAASSAPRPNRSDATFKSSRAAGSALTALSGSASAKYLQSDE